jgi:hypothetical protein
MKDRNTITIFTTILLALACSWLAQTARAVVPAPDGGYAGNNTAEGTSALFSLTTGIDNTALGFQALFHNSTGNFNTAEGFRALFSDTTGAQNTATGVNALLSNTTGNFNTATGVNTLFHNSTGNFNTATGVNALFANADASQNSAFGFGALASNTAFNNTADGYLALNHNTIGSGNTANGSQALTNNTTGGSNTAIGDLALSSNTVGNHNIALGIFAGTALTTGDFNIDIGNNGFADESNTIRIGTPGDQTKTFIAGINSAVVSGGVVFVNGAGQLGIAISSARFKDEIKSIDKASEGILALRPVTFRYKNEIDPDRTPQFGLVAEEVEKVNPDLIIRDPDGKPYTVRYEAVNAMLLNEFLKEHKTVQELKKEIAALTATVKEQDSRIQKVSDQLKLSKPATKVVLKNP